MDNRKINYLARTFNDYKSELIKFSNKYYPELADSYNDSSVGSWFIDLVAAVRCVEHHHRLLDAGETAQFHQSAVPGVDERDQ